MADVKMVGSGSKAADALIFTGPAVLRGFIVTTDGAADVTIDVYDKTTATGTKLIPTFTVKGANNYGGVMNAEIQAATGIYLDITTSGTAGVVVYYSAGY